MRNIIEIILKSSILYRVKNQLQMDLQYSCVNNKRLSTFIQYNSSNYYTVFIDFVLLDIAQTLNRFCVCNVWSCCWYCTLSTIISHWPTEAKDYLETDDHQLIWCDRPCVVIMLESLLYGVVFLCFANDCRMLHFWCADLCAPFLACPSPHWLMVSWHPSPGCDGCDDCELGQWPDTSP